MIVSRDWTVALIDRPWLAALLWVVLHALDWSLTIRGAQKREELLTRFDLQGSAYELNPLFQNDVVKLSYFSRRFLVSWIVVALAFYASFTWLDQSHADRDALATWFVGAALGALVFTRLTIVARHLRNIYLFGRMLEKGSSPSAVDARTNLELSAMMLFEGASMLGLAALLSHEAWAAGGAIGIGLLGCKHFLLARRAPR